MTKRKKKSPKPAPARGKQITVPDQTNPADPTPEPADSTDDEQIEPSQEPPNPKTPTGPPEPDEEFEPEPTEDPADESAPDLSDSESEDSALRERLLELEKKLEAVEAKYADRFIADALRTAYIERGGQPSAADTAVLAIRAGAADSIRLDPRGDLQFLDPDNKPLCDDDGVRLDPDSFVRRWLADNPIFIRPDSRTGSRSAPSAPAEPASISDSEIIRQIRSAHTPDEILKLAESLGLK